MRAFIFRCVCVSSLILLTGCKANDSKIVQSGIIKFDYANEIELSLPKEGESLVILEKANSHFIRVTKVNQKKISPINVLVTNGLYLYPGTYSLELVVIDKREYPKLNRITGFRLDYSFLSGHKYKLAFDHYAETPTIELRNSDGQVLAKSFSCDC